VTPERSTFFDLWSRFYDLPPVQLAVYRPVHQMVLRELAEHGMGRVLDVGCGTGILTARLAGEAGAELVAGCDFSLGMLTQARERDGRIGWVQADALRLPIADGAFDAVVSTEAFHWFPDPDAALAEFHRVLAPGGRALVALVNLRREQTSRLMHGGSEALGQPAWWPTRAEMRSRFERAGLGGVRQRRVLRVAGLLIPTVVTVGEKPASG
jgi:ubiquinone/menaquinone biosynthesis C-methylase UbiE